MPDDVTKDNTGVAASGWLYEKNSTNFGTMSFANDNNTSTCADEGTDISLLNATFPGNTDSEPDIFQVNAPGLSCQLVFDQTGHVHVTPYQDIVVNFTTSAIGNADQQQITSFTITNDRGITYVFSATSSTTQQASTSAITNPDVNYFKSDYNYYKNGITYYNSWGLTSISDVHGNAITIGYIPAATKSFQNFVGLTTGGTNMRYFYAMSGTVGSQLVAGITITSNIASNLPPAPDVSITYGSTPQSNQSVVANISVMGHDFIFGYKNIASKSGYASNINSTYSVYYSWYFLNNIIDETCSAQSINGQTVAISSYAPLNLTFNYYNTVMR